MGLPDARWQAHAHAHPLPAPQANLIAALAHGVIEHNLNWNMLAIGAGLGVAVVLLDEIMGRVKLLRLPPLAVGIAIYLPMSATLGRDPGRHRGAFLQSLRGAHEGSQRAKDWACSPPPA